jgi:hypothetical protein
VRVSALGWRGDELLFRERRGGAGGRKRGEIGHVCRARRNKAVRGVLSEIAT